MYLGFFGLSEPPFAITPDPRFVWLSEQHQEALAHLQYAVSHGGGGGFVQLTGEVGTGKTTISRLFIDELPEDVEVALVLHPSLDPVELLSAIAAEFGIKRRRGTKEIALIEALQKHLLELHAAGKTAVVIIDEAQNLRPEALEQVRLLTNLETATAKLLQIILLGQPELIALLQRPDLRQLAQRITARFHLQPLALQETRALLSHRLRVAGGDPQLFSERASRAIHRRAGGIPRLINVLADRSLLAAYASRSPRIRSRDVRRAAREVSGEQRSGGRRGLIAVGLAAILAVGALLWWFAPDTPDSPAKAMPAVPRVVEPPPGFDEPGRALAELARLRGLSWSEDRCPYVAAAVRCLRVSLPSEQRDTLQSPYVARLAEDRWGVVENRSSGPQLLAPQGAAATDVEIEDELFLLVEAPGYVNEITRPGSRGPPVLWLKQRARQTSPAYSGLVDDPYYGDDFEAWVVEFQRSRSLAGDGIIGARTLALLVD